MSAVALVSVPGLADHHGMATENPVTRAALRPVRGVPLVLRAIRGLRSSGCVRHIVVTTLPGDVAATRSALGRPDGDAADVRVVPGQQDRVESLRLGLDAALNDVPDARMVLVHDAARAFAPAELVSSVFAELGRGAPAVVPVLPLADTVKRVDWSGRVVATPDRGSLRVLQTPQGFQVDVLRAACAAEGTGTLLERLNRLGIPARTVPGHPYARRISTDFDFTVAEVVLSQDDPSTHGGDQPRSGRHLRRAPESAPGRVAQER